MLQSLPNNPSPPHHHKPPSSFSGISFTLPRFSIIALTNGWKTQHLEYC